MKQIASVLALMLVATAPVVAQTVIDNFDDDDDISNWFSNPLEYALTEVSDQLQVATTLVGPTFQTFGLNLPAATDFSATRVVRLRIKTDAPSPPSIRLDLGDGGHTTNATPLTITPISDGTFHEYIFDFTDRFRQNDDMLVDSTAITQLIFFFNPGGLPFSDTVCIDDILRDTADSSGVPVVYDDFDNYRNLSFYFDGDPIDNNPFASGENPTPMVGRYVKPGNPFESFGGGFNGAQNTNLSARTCGYLLVYSNDLTSEVKLSLQTGSDVEVTSAVATTTQTGVWERCAFDFSGFDFPSASAIEKFVFVFTETTGGTVFFDDFRFESGVCAKIPVELVTFDAVLDGQVVHLNWATASETNNAGFEVQRLREDDTRNPKWDVLGFVGGRGTTVAPQQYRYRIEGSAPGLHTFRLKQIDFDGTVAYSPAVEVSLSLTLPEGYRLTEPYPNPFNPRALFSLVVAHPQVVKVGVYDVLGRLVRVLHEGPLAANEPREFIVEAGDLSSGVYLVRADGETFTGTRRVVLLK